MRDVAPFNTYQSGKRAVGDDPKNKDPRHAIYQLAAKLRHFRRRTRNTQ